MEGWKFIIHSYNLDFFWSKKGINNAPVHMLVTDLSTLTHYCYV